VQVLEEAPAPGITAEFRRGICDAAIAAARAVGYVNAGTVEFIVDADSSPTEPTYYFCEMNTRLQACTLSTSSEAGVSSPSMVCEHRPRQG
jgi:3-methylcrotonyl-CoA carboxylase alpha subunit